MIGSCSLHHLDEGFHRAATGYELHRAFWGKGIMFEAMSVVLTYGFTELGLHRVEAFIDPANERRVFYGTYPMCNAFGTKS